MDFYDVIFLLAFMVIWFILVKIILPKMGINT